MSWRCLLLITAVAVASPQTSSIELVQSSLTSSLDKIFADLQTWTVRWLAVFILLQFTWSNIGLLVGGADWEKVWAKFLGSIMWCSICVYVFNSGPDFIKSVSNLLLTKATGVTGSSFDPFSPLEKGLQVASQLLTTLDGTQSILGSLNPFPSIMMGLVAVVILGVSGLVSFKVLMIFIETKIVIALSPLSFSLLGLNAFKDQGLAPFKYLVSLAYRVMILAAVIAAMVSFSDSIVAAFQALPAASDPGVWPPIWAAAIGYGMLGALTLRADSIATMLASGTSQMSPGDAASVGAAAAAAAGAGMALGAVSAGASGAAASSVAKVPEAMGSFMARMGGSSSISNASRTGSGSAATEAPKRPASMSASGSSSSGSAPARSSSPDEAKGTDTGRGASSTASMDTAKAPSRSGATVHALGEGTVQSPLSPSAPDMANSASTRTSSSTEVSAPGGNAGKDAGSNGITRTDNAPASSSLTAEAGGKGAAQALRSSSAPDMSGSAPVRPSISSEVKGAGKKAGESARSTASMDTSHVPTGSNSTVKSGIDQMPRANSSRGGAPIRPASASSDNSTTPPIRATGPLSSGKTAGIGGPNSDSSDQKLDMVMDALARQGQPPKKTTSDHLSKAHEGLNKVLQSDTPGVHVSMNTHSDNI